MINVFIVQIVLVLPANFAISLWKELNFKAFWTLGTKMLRLPSVGARPHKVKAKNRISQLKVIFLTRKNKPWLHSIRNKVWLYSPDFLDLN